MRPVQDLSAKGLAIRLLGTVEVSWRGRPLEPFPTRDAELLFAFLALHRSRMHARDVLTGAFWGELSDEIARKRLRTALWRTRSTLDVVVPTADYLSVCRDRLGFMPTGSYQLDVEEFENRIRSALSSTAQDSACDARRVELESAVALYRGDLLEGEYAEWCLSERDRLQVLYLDALEALMRCHSTLGAWGHALDCGNRILDKDPLREQVHREVMALYYLAGDRPRALRQFNACEQTLKDELGVDPMRSTHLVKQALETEDVAALSALVCARRAS